MFGSSPLSPTLRPLCLLFVSFGPPATAVWGPFCSGRDLYFGSFLPCKSLPCFWHLSSCTSTGVSVHRRVRCTSVSPSQLHVFELLFSVLVCLSIDVTGALVLFYLISLVLLHRFVDLFLVQCFNLAVHLLLRSSAPPYLNCGLTALCPFGGRVVPLMCCPLSSWDRFCFVLLSVRFVVFLFLLRSFLCLVRPCLSCPGVCSVVGASHFCLLASSPRGFQFATFAGTSLWVSGCSCDGSVALLRAGSVIVLCHPSVKCLMATKAQSPVWGFHPLHHVADDVWELSLATLRYSSDDDPGPTLDSAKLPYCYSNVIGAAFSAPVLLCHPGTFILVACCSVCLSGSVLVWSPFFVCVSGWTFVPSLACLPSPTLSQVWTYGA